MDQLLFRTATKFINDVFGFLYSISVPVIIVLLSLITTLDLFYLIATPGKLLVDKFFNGERFGGFRLVSKDAVVARERANERGTQATLEYLKLRIKTYVAVAVTIFLILQGIPFVIDVLSEFLIVILQAIGIVKR